MMADPSSPPQAVLFLLLVLVFEAVAAAVVDWQDE